MDSRKMKEKLLEIARKHFFFKQWSGQNKKKTGRLLDGKEYNQMPKKAYKP